MEMLAKLVHIATLVEPTVSITLVLSAPGALTDRWKGMLYEPVGGGPVRRWWPEMKSVQNSHQTLSYYRYISAQ